MNDQPSSSAAPGEPPWVAVGLPATWTPGPIAWRFGKLQGVGPDGPIVSHLLIIDGPGGRTAFMFSADDLATLARQALEQSRGLTVAAALPTAPTNGAHR